MRRFTLRHLAISLFLLIPLAAWAHGISDEDKQRMLDGGCLQYIGLGGRSCGEEAHAINLSILPLGKVL